MSVVEVPPDLIYDLSIPILTTECLESWARDHPNDIYQGPSRTKPGCPDWEYYNKVYNKFRKDLQIARDNEVKAKPKDKHSKSRVSNSNQSHHPELIDLESSPSPVTSRPRLLSSSSEDEIQPSKTKRPPTKVIPSPKTNNPKPAEPKTSLIKKKTTKRRIRLPSSESEDDIDQRKTVNSIPEKRPRTELDESQVKNAEGKSPQAQLNQEVRTITQINLDSSDSSFFPSLSESSQSSVKSPGDNVVDQNQPILDNDKSLPKPNSSDEIEIHVVDDEFAKFKDAPDEDFEVSKNLQKIRSNITKKPVKSNDNHNQTKGPLNKLTTNQPNQNKLTNGKVNNKIMNPKPKQQGPQTNHQTNGISTGIAGHNKLDVPKKVNGTIDNGPVSDKPNWPDTLKKFEENNLRIVYRDLKHFKNLIKTEPKIEKLPKDLIFKCMGLDEVSILKDILELIFELEYQNMTEFWSELVLRFKRKLIQFGPLRVYKTKTNPDIVHRQYLDSMTILADFANKTNLKVTLPYHDLPFLQNPVEFVRSKEVTSTGNPTTIATSTTTETTPSVSQVVPSNGTQSGHDQNTNPSPINVQNGGQDAQIISIKQPQIQPIIQNGYTNGFSTTDPQFIKQSNLTSTTISTNAPLRTLKNIDTNPDDLRNVICTEDLNIRGKINFKVSARRRPK